MTEGPDEAAVAPPPSPLPPPPQAAKNNTEINRMDVLWFIALLLTEGVFLTLG